MVACGVFQALEGEYHFVQRRVPVGALVLQVHVDSAEVSGRKLRVVREGSQRRQYPPGHLAVGLRIVLVVHEHVFGIEERQADGEVVQAVEYAGGRFGVRRPVVLLVAVKDVAEGEHGFFTRRPQSVGDAGVAHEALQQREAGTRGIVGEIPDALASVQV